MLNYRSVMESYQADPEAADGFVREAFRRKDIKPTDIDLGRLFEACFGWQEFQACRQGDKLAHDVIAAALTESAGATMTNAFQTITQQLMYATVIEAYESPEFIFQRMIPTRTSRFKTERIPGISGLGDARQAVPEGEPFPLVGVSEEWQDSPVTAKYGFRVAATREAVFFDQTGLLADRLSKASYWEALKQEYAAIDCVIDENAGAISAVLGGHRYHYKGNSIASYGDNSGTHNFDNLQGTNALVDYTDVENTELLFDAMTDPTTGVITGAFRAASNQLVVTTQLLHTAKQVVHATSIRLHAGGYPVTGNPAERTSDNTLQDYQIVTSPLLAARLATDTSWFTGNIAKACEWVENWPQEVKQAPSNSQDEFERDIVMQFRVSRLGAYHVRQPRYLVKSTVA
jgi:hypothetical protein